MLEPESMEKQYSEFIYTRSYARWLEKEGRRERWPETVQRYESFFIERVPEQYRPEYSNAVHSVMCKEVMPSMRCMWTAGPALRRESAAGYNCAYTTITKPRDFAEILYVLMCGTGMGFSVERQDIAQLPCVPTTFIPDPAPAAVDDSKLGWAQAYEFVIDSLYGGTIPMLDYSQVRPKGSRLKTFGGRASGPEPLRHLVDFTISTFKNASGRKLNSLEVYDIVCTIANCVVVGGVRRSATISLSNLSDQRMRDAKTGQFWIDHPYRALANNSVAYTEKPEMGQFIDEWATLMRSGSGERGIINRVSFNKKASELGRDTTYAFGPNPCGEIILRPKQFCNLTEVVVRADDELADLKRKVKHAVIMGVLQSTLTDFTFLSPEWKKNCEDERLLGVSLTGLADHPILKQTCPLAKLWLREMQSIAQGAAIEWAFRLGINVPKAVTCVKPSGTVSQLVGSSSGLHPRYAKYYIRRVRVDVHDSLCKYLLGKGIPAAPEVGQDWLNANVIVFDFPQKSPSSASACRDDKTALQQLEYWKMLKEHWCDHNPSCTIYVRDHEWLSVGAWVYENWDVIGGLSFLPYDGGLYELAPFEEITEERYNEMLAKFPVLDFSELKESADETSGAQELACSSGTCELVL